MDERAFYRYLKDMERLEKTLSDLYDFKVTIIHETDKAVLVRANDDKEHWFPLSIIENHRDGTFTVPMEWAVEKDII